MLCRVATDAVARQVGNGTGSRDAQQWLSSLLTGSLAHVRVRQHGSALLSLPSDMWCPQYGVVDEAGASVYSVSKLAREEFGDLPPGIVSAASIARRMQVSWLSFLCPCTCLVDTTPVQRTHSLNW